jgi:DNA-binding response OmpR family regulator
MGPSSCSGSRNRNYVVHTVKNPSILIVEDDGLIALSLLQLLQRSGFDVPDPVESGEQAIDFVQASPTDLILMDIRLAGKIDGIETAREIRKNFGTPVIFLTAHSETELQTVAEKISPYGFFVKPFVEKEVLSAIGKALGRRG